VDLGRWCSADLESFETVKTSHSINGNRKIRIAPSVLGFVEALISARKRAVFGWGKTHFTD
jgi:hypothetical protein